MAATFLCSLFQPARTHLLQAPVRRSLRALLSQRGFLLFLISVFCAALTLGTVYPFLSLYLNGIGASAGTIGLAWTLAAITEVPIMLGAGVLVRRLSSRGLLKVAFVVLAVRWFALSFIQNPFWALATQLLHGLSFRAYWIAAVNMVNDWAPEGLETTAMAILTIVASGLAAIFGSLLGGFFYDHLGMSLLFRVLSLVAVIGLGIILTIKVPPPKAASRWPAA
jgi:PPP family 3-phenylpropionic acid transporter